MSSRRAQSLRHAGYESLKLTGDMEMATRDAVAEQFKAVEAKVLIATDIVARGFDVSTVTLVVNYDLPIEYRTGKCATLCPLRSLLASALGRKRMRLRGRRALRKPVCCDQAPVACAAGLTTPTTCTESGARVALAGARVSLSKTHVTLLASPQVRVRLRSRLPTLRAFTRVSLSYSAS